VAHRLRGQSLALSEDFYIISFGHDRLPGMGSGNRSESGVGIYYFDRWGIWNSFTRTQDGPAWIPYL